MSDVITSERQAKKQQERAMELLREVREWVWANRGQGLPAEPDAPVSRKAVEDYAAYNVWFFSLRDAMHMLDPGYDK